MYRAVALAARERARPPAEVAPTLSLELGERVRVDGRDVTAEIRAPEVSEAASVAAAQPAAPANGEAVLVGLDVGAEPPQPLNDGGDPV